MKPHAVVLLSILVAVIASIATIKMVEPEGSSAQVAESTYGRVLRTRTLRCAYMLWPQFIERDPNTGAFSGFDYDMMDAVGQSLGLKVEWTAEIALGTQVDTLLTGKADAICGGEGTIQTNATVQLAYTEPFAYFPIYAFVRADDARFTDDNSRVNAEDVKVSAIDADVSMEILRTLYTKAKPVPLPQLSDGAQMTLEVMAGKADVVLNDDLSMSTFMTNNPGKLRKVSNRPIITIPNTFSTLRTEMPLADMLSQGTKNVRDRGIEDAIMKKYGFSGMNIYPVAKHYVLGVAH
jgi:ABC-type amino acid transport substrate-binding protein